MIETATSDFGERVSGSLEPLWSVVKALQGGLKDMQGAVKVAAKDVAGLTAQQVRTPWDCGSVCIFSSS